MNLNSIQISIFKKLSKDEGMEVDAYIKENSMEFIEVQRNGLSELTEEDGDAWINKAYIISLSGTQEIILH